MSTEKSVPRMLVPTAGGARFARPATTTTTGPARSWSAISWSASADCSAPDGGHADSLIDRVHATGCEGHNFSIRPSGMQGWISRCSVREGSHEESGCGRRWRRSRRVGVGVRQSAGRVRRHRLGSHGRHLGTSETISHGLPDSRLLERTSPPDHPDAALMDRWHVDVPGGAAWQA
jgi:hypothetical protein